jgi:GAF domain-containing protein
VVVQDAAADPRWGAELDPALDGGIRSVLCVPLETRGRVLGVIEVVNKQGEGAFTDRDLNVVTKLAGFAAIAIENARLYQQTKQLTLTDELTRLYNTRFFTQYLETEVKRCRRYGGSVGLIFLDLDHFKLVTTGTGTRREPTAALIADGCRGVRDVTSWRATAATSSS